MYKILLLSTLLTSLSVACRKSYNFSGNLYDAEGNPVTNANYYYTGQDRHKSMTEDGGFSGGCISTSGDAENVTITFYGLEFPDKVITIKCDQKNIKVSLIKSN